MDLISALTLLGGVATRRQLVELRGRREIDCAIREQRLVSVGRGRWALPEAAEANRLAGRIGAALSHRSAAQWWGWEQKSTDHLPDVILPRNRVVPGDQRHCVNAHWADLSSDHLDCGRTSMTRTITDCMRALAFDEALAIADSCLRAGDFTGDELIRLAAGLRGRGATQARRVARLATARAANPFESVLRAIALDVPGLTVQSQCPVEVESCTIHPDLGDPRRRIAIEAEGFEWHSKREDLRRDCLRYNSLARQGWVVVRFTWEQVMFAPEEVSAVLTDVVAVRPVVHQEA